MFIDIRKAICLKCKNFVSFTEPCNPDGYILQDRLKVAKAVCPIDAWPQLSSEELDDPTNY